MKKWGLPLLLLGACLIGCQETQPTTDGGQAETEIADHASQTAQTDQDANSAATSEKILSRKKPASLQRKERQTPCGRPRRKRP